jgi:L-lactate dehydrogenase complex protein LldE
MTVGLFIPCYIDQLYPQVGRATVTILERLGYDISFPSGQTCCGQPMSNSGYAALGDPLITTFIRLFDACDHVVSPSASCLLHLKEKLEARHHPLHRRIYELTEFLHDIVPEDRLPRLDATFPFRVGLHQSCHGLRGLGLARPSECMTPDFSKPARLLSRVSQLTLIGLDRPDECCGFGGTFSVFEPDVSVAMGRDRLHDHLSHGAEYITSTDMSCLMHLGGLLGRSGAVAKPIHIAEILASR